MAQPLERDIEMVLLHGTTGEEIATSYAKIVNDAMLNSRDVYSRAYSEMMERFVTYTSIQEIKGVYFAEIEYAVGRPLTKEEMFGADTDA